MDYCAVCHEEIGEFFYRFLDNFLQVKFFDELDGTDNMFCSTACACNALMLTEIENENYKKDKAEKIGIAEDEV